jgi:hypothetical protein
MDTPRPELSQSPVVPAPTLFANTERARFFLFVNGILQGINSFNAWHLAAEEWIESPRTPPAWRADTFSYHTGIFRFGQSKFITECCRKLTARQDQYRAAGILVETIAVGHSNGCDILCKTLQENPSLRIDELQLIGAANSASFEKNGLNAALAQGRVDSVVVHWSKSDGVLHKGGFFGYGGLGKTGPQDVRRARGVLDVEWQNTGHSGYFHPSRFDELMTRVINHGLIPE